MKHVWLLLDIKVDNDADEVMKLTGEVIREVGGSIQFWGRRILLGVWAVSWP